MRALIIVDPQNDFCTGGSLAVPNSNDIFPTINCLKNKKEFFSAVFITKDWHPLDHISFAVNHDTQPFHQIEVSSGKQMMWPVHCAQNTPGAEVSPLLEVDGSEVIVLKGLDKDEDCYSGFGTAKNPSKLLKQLQQLKITEIYVVGLALDYCVKATALDGAKNGFETTVIAEATKPVSEQAQGPTVEKLKEAGVKYENFDSLKL